MQSIQVKQILFLILILFIFLLLFGFLIYSSSASASVTEELVSGKRKLIQYRGENITIDTDEVITGDIVIENGQLTIAGKLHGNVLAFDSEVFLDSSAAIFGHVISYRKEIIRAEKALVAGKLVQWAGAEVQIQAGSQLEGYNFPLTLYQAPTQIVKEQTVYGDLLLYNSEITVHGKVDGSIINMLGEARLSKTAAVDGNIISYRGRLIREPESLVTGRMLTLSEQPEELPEENKDDQQIRAHVEKKYLKRQQPQNSDIFRFWGDITIEPDELIRGDVVTLRGTIKVQGEVDGDVVSVFGGVELDSLARVNGDVVAVGGKIYRSPAARVTGDLVQTTITGVTVEDGDQHVSVGWHGVSVKPKKGDEWERKRRPHQNQWSPSIDDEPFMFRYNRVEGLFLGLKLEKDDWRGRGQSWFDLYGHAGYGFARKRACYQIGLERNFFGKYGPIIGAEAHDVVHSEDEWIIPTFENSLAALFLREDFQDYFRRAGYSAYISHDLSEYLTLTAEYRQDHHYDLKRKTQWSIFGGDKKFRENPLIDEIEFRSVAATAILDTRNDYKYPNQGWLINITGEFAGKDFKNPTVDFNRYIVDIRRYQPITSGENLDFRVRAGSSFGHLPRQLQFDIGGLSTIRGYNYKEFANDSSNQTNRLLLGNIEYRIFGRRSPFNRMLGGSDFSLILFADAGMVWSVADTVKAQQGFDHLDWDDLYTAVGFGIGNREGNVRLDFAKRMDRKGEPLVVTFRINRPF